MTSSYRLEENMKRYVTMTDQELMKDLSHAHEVIESNVVTRQRAIGRRAVAHIEFEVLQRLDDGHREE